MRIALLYTPRERTPNKEHLSPRVIDEISGALRREFDVTPLEFEPKRAIECLRSTSADLIFNLAYGYESPQGDVLLSQPDVVEMLEQAGYWSVGSASAVQRLMQDKLLCGRRLQEFGFMAPREVHPSNVDVRQGRAIVKPRFGGCHRDVKVVDPRSVASVDEAEFVYQAFVDGRELTVGVIERDGEPVVLPPLEVCSDVDPVWLTFADYRRSCVRAVGYPDDVESNCLRVFEALGMHDYARIDLRLTDDGCVFLDLNALPNLDSALSLLPMAASLRGISYDDLIVGLARNCAGRRPAP